jgi:hypothetical protein
MGIDSILHFRWSFRYFVWGHLKGEALCICLCVLLRLEVKRLCLSRRGQSGLTVAAVSLGSRQIDQRLHSPDS